MSELESAVKTPTAPMIQERQRTQLDFTQQLLPATWVTKTAMVLDALYDGPDVFSQDERELLRTQSVPPSHARIRMGILDPALESIGPVRYLRVLGHIGPTATSRDHAGGFVIGLGMGPLFFSYLSPPERHTPSLARNGRVTPRWFELLPPSTSAEWPPSQLLDADASFNVITEVLSKGFVQLPRQQLLESWAVVSTR